MANTTTNKCFACDRKLGKTPKLVDTRDEQVVFVGSECFKLIEKAGEAGYQPKGGGPRLFLLTERTRLEYEERMAAPLAGAA